MRSRIYIAADVVAELVASGRTERDAQAAWLRHLARLEISMDALATAAVEVVKKHLQPGFFATGGLTAGGRFTGGLFTGGLMGEAGPEAIMPKRRAKP